MRRHVILFVILALAGSGLARAMHDVHHHHGESSVGDTGIFGAQADSQHDGSTDDAKRDKVGGEKPCDLCVHSIFSDATASFDHMSILPLHDSAILGPRAAPPLELPVIRRDRPPR